MKTAKTREELGLIRENLYQLLNDNKGGDVSFWVWLKRIFNPIKRKQADENATMAIVDKDIYAYYEELENDHPTVDYLKHAGFGEWLVVEKIPDHYERTRSKYEAFVSGFLYFFEKHVSKNPKENRTLFFDWGTINKKAHLTIFLKPLYHKEHNYDNNGYYKGHEGHNDNGYIDENLHRDYIASPPGDDTADSTFQTDPPKPPGPPPPPRQ